MLELITATQYAQAHNLSDRTVRHKAQTGQFKTATKKGKTWYIDNAEPFPEVDGRRTTGAYVDWRQKHSRRVSELQNPVRGGRPLDYRTLPELQNPSKTTEP